MALKRAFAVHLNQYILNEVITNKTLSVVFIQRSSLYLIFVFYGNFKIFVMSDVGHFEKCL